MICEIQFAAQTATLSLRKPSASPRLRLIKGFQPVSKALKAIQSKYLSQMLFEFSPGSAGLSRSSRNRNRNRNLPVRIVCTLLAPVLHQFAPIRTKSRQFALVRSRSLPFFDILTLTGSIPHTGIISASTVSEALGSGARSAQAQVPGGAKAE